MELAYHLRHQHKLLRDRFMSLRWEQVQKHRSASQLKSLPKLSARDACADVSFWVSARPYLNRLKIVFQTILFTQDADTMSTRKFLIQTKNEKNYLATRRDSHFTQNSFH
jgi:hypothetical protein